MCLRVAAGTPAKSVGRTTGVARSSRAANFAICHQALRIVAGDVRGIERNTKQRQSAGRHLRQQ